VDSLLANIVPTVRREVMRTIAIDEPDVCQSVCHARIRRANAVERIEFQFGLKTFGEPENISLESQFLPRIQCGLCQITLASC